MQRARFTLLLACLCAIASAVAVAAAAAPTASGGQVADGTIQTAASLCDHMPRVAQEAYQLFNANRVAAARKKKAEIDVLFARAVAMDPSHAPCYATAAQIALGTHEFDRAIDLFGRAGLLFAANGDIDAERVAQRGEKFAKLGKMSTERDAAYRGGQVWRFCCSFLSLSLAESCILYRCLHRFLF